jgi:hypothetical protein
MASHIVAISRHATVSAAANLYFHIDKKARRDERGTPPRRDRSSGDK